MKRVHYTIEEKTEIIKDRVGSGTDACKIAEATDEYTFAMLNDLIQALRKIRRGK